MGAPLRNLASRLLADSHDYFEESFHRYETASGSAAFWMMCDLRSSASFRIAIGEQAAFVRALGFVQLCRRLGEVFDDVQVFKELGDAVLVRATDPRELLEFLVLLDLVGAYAQVDEERDPKWPSLSVRSAITFGTAFQVGEDYLGQAIDRLARVSGYKSESKTMLAVIDHDAKVQFDRLLSEYPYVTLGNSFLVPPELLKQGEPPFRLSELRIDRAEAVKARDYFAHARAALGGGDAPTVR